MKYLFITCSILITFSSLSQVPSFVPNNGLIGWWPFNGNANDESTNGNNGTVNGATLNMDRFGIQDAAYSFDGVDDNISVPNIAVSGNSARSIFAWVKTQNTAPGCVIGTGGSGQNAGEFNLVIGYGPGSTSYPGITGVMGGNFTQLGNDFYPSSGVMVSNNDWHFIGVVYDGNGIIKTYVDGVLDNSGTMNYNTIGQINFFGYNNHNGSQFDGLIDDIGFWNRALTDQEILDLYNGCHFPSSVIQVTQNANVLTADQASATYQWLDCNNTYSPIPNATNQTFTPSITGNYAVEITLNGCSDTSACFLVDYTGITELIGQSKEIVRITDVSGRTTDFKPNTLLILYYNDGTIQRYYKVE